MSTSRSADTVSRPAQAESQPFDTGLAALLARLPAFWIGALIVILWLAVALCWPLLAPHDPYATNLAAPLSPPSAAHLFGTDDLGRDVFSRVLAGAAPLFLVAPAATALQLFLGLLVGMSAGYLGGRADSLLMRAVDVVIVLPSLIVLVIIVKVLGVSVFSLVFVIALSGVPTLSRQARNLTLQLKTRDFVAAARLRGESGGYIVSREILPNLASALTAEAVVRFGWSTLASVSLGFLGVSWQPPSADWGLAINTQRAYLQVQPFAVLGPTLALALLMIGVSTLGDAVNKAVRER